MRDTQAGGLTQTRRPLLKEKRTYIRQHYLLYLMLLPPVCYYLLFHYVPMGGVVIAFKNYSIFRGIWNSPWVGLGNYAKLFSIAEFFNAIRNTLTLNVLNLIVGFPAPILLALMLNELTNKTFKKISQTVLYLPHFMSWVIVGGLVSMLFATQTGVINRALSYFGTSPVPWLSEDGWWVFMYVFVSVWQSVGWGAIIYLSAMTGISEELYEAARIDGCSRLKMMLHITLPGIRSTIVIVLILRIGSMMSIGFEQPQMLKNSMVNNVADVISTFIYRYGLENGKYSISTAAGLIQSVINFALVITANAVSNKISDEGIW
ncbi:MAG TPA: ABC transporter permease subunit [Clostridia bacterium]|nr:ABC transporter permease subunit [Clostridia bacterium]